MRWLRRILIFILVLLLAGAGYLLWTIRRSFPQVDGEIRVEGLNDVVTVHRDRWGIPYIEATSDHDLFFAQGFVHAQERFWQMDFWRHIGSGRLSEMFGESQVETDMFLRSLGFADIARQELELMPAEHRQLLQAYADGVNAYVSTRSEPELSLEYAVLGLQNPDYEIEPWEPIHTLTWAKLMSWDLSGNLHDEVLRAQLSAVIPRERLEEIMPPYPDDQPVIVESEGPASGPPSDAAIPAGSMPMLDRAARNARALHAITGGGFAGIGSNSWVVDGTRTATGGPILANDTHLAPQMPAIWFVNGLHCSMRYPECSYSATGLSFPGAPGVVVGHNGHHAWGVTTEMVDTQDLFVERVNPEDPDQYEVEGQWVDFETRTETIRVAGGEDVEFEVRSTRHGPVVSGTLIHDQAFDGSTVVEVPEDYVVALAWESLKPSTIFEAILGIGRARGYGEFQDAIALWDIAAQNVIYADTSGDIAYHATGRVPIRASGDGSVPVPGWTTEYDWVGVVPLDQLPTLFNPASGMIVTANNPVTRPGTGNIHFGLSGNRGLRAARIITMLESAGALDVEDMRRLQMDTFDTFAAEMVPLLLQVGSSEPGVLRIQELLRNWATSSAPFSATGDSAGAAAWMATWRHLLLEGFGDELGEDRLPDGEDRWMLAVSSLMNEPDNPWWDDTTTEGVETRDDILIRAMSEASSELTARMGDNPGSWSWGRLHVARFRNQSLGQSGIGPIEWLFNRTAPRRVGGSSTLVNAVGWNAAVGYEVDWIPSFRMVIDIQEPSRSSVMHSTGQSGHAFHVHYDDMIEPWVEGIQAPMLWEADDIERAARATLTLGP
ncbi:MAG TPA: penicillin acylase family protein [Acidimicrobiia bacterium]